MPSDGSPERRIALQAAALPPAQLRTTALNALPDTAVGASQSADVARLENTGTQDAWLSQLRSESGVFTPESPSAEHCREGQVLAAGKSCLLRLRFAPVAGGEQRTQLQVLAAPGAVALALAMSARTPPAPAATPAPAVGGGGGSASPAFLAGLLAIAALLRRRRA